MFGRLRLPSAAALFQAGAAASAAPVDARRAINSKMRRLLVIALCSCSASTRLQ